MNFKSNHGKNGLVSVLLFLVLLFGSFEVFGHPADPSSLLSKYSLYGKNGFTIMSGAKFAPKGWLGTDLNFNQADWGINTFHDTIKVGGTFQKGAGSKTYTAKSVVYVGNSVSGTSPTPSGYQLVHPATITNPDWPAFSATDINPGPTNYIGTTVTLSPGAYGNLEVNSTTNNTITLQSGLYEFNNVTLGCATGTGGLVIDKAKEEVTRILIKGDLTLTNKGRKELISTVINEDYGRVLIFVAGNVTIENELSFMATILAPNADVTIGTGLKIYGQIMANTITIKDGFDGADGEFVPWDPTKISLVGADSIQITEAGGSRLVNIPIQLGGTMDTASSVEYEIRQINGNPKLYARDTLIDFSSYTNGATKTGTLNFPAESTVPNETVSIWIVDDLLDTSYSHEGQIEHFELRLFNPEVALLERDPNAHQIVYANPPADSTVTELIYRIPIINDDFNQAPNAVIDTFYINEGDSLLLDVLANDSDPDGNPIIVSAISTKPVNADTAWAVNNGIIYVHNDQENVIDSLVYQIEDQPTGATDIAKVIIIITPVSDQNPFSNPDTILVNEHDSTNVTTKPATSLLANDTDPEAGDIITFSKILTPAKYGLMTIQTDGTFQYKHTSNSEINFLDTVIYEIKDPGNNFDTAFAYIIINPVNDNSPTGINHADTVTEGQTLSVTPKGLLSGADDLDLLNNAHGLTPAEVLKINTTPIKNASKGTIALNSTGSYSYIPNDEAYGNDTIVFTVLDQVGHASTNCTLTITIIPINDNPPVATNDAITIDENDSTSTLNSGITNLMSLVSDPDLPNDSLTITASNANHGTFTLNLDNTFKYVNEGLGVEYTTDTVSYTVQDAVGNTATGYIFITINLTNDETPIATDNTINVAVPGGTQTILANGNSSVLDDDSDLDVGDTKTATLLDSTVNGTLTLNSDGTFTYTHITLVNLFDSATYICEDGAGHKDTAKIFIGIALDFSTKPTAGDDQILVNEGASTQKLINDSTTLFWNDNGNDVLDKIKGFVISGPSHGSFSLDSASGTFIYEHDDSENFTDTVTYYVEDLDGLKDTANIFITIMPINDNSPILAVDTIYVDEGGTAIVLWNDSTSVLHNDTDLDLPHDMLIASIKDSSSDGSITLNTNGTFIYTHNGKENDFEDNFVYTVSDTAATPHTASQIVYIIVSPVNDNDPVKDTSNFLVVDEGDSTTVTFDGDTSLLADISDPDSGDTLSISSIVKVASHGTFIITDSIAGTFIYIHDGSENFTDTIIYTISDKAGHSILDTLPVIINPINDNTPVGMVDSIIVNEGGVISVLSDNITISVLANDLDADVNTTLIASLLDTSGITNCGIIKLNSDGTFEYEHDDSEIFIDSFSYIVSDGLFSDTVSVYINITPLNDNLTVVNPDTITVIEGQSVDTLTTGAISVLTNDTDIDGKTGVTVLLVKKPIVGTVTLNPDGTFEYIHNGSEVYEDDFTYVAIDGQDTTIATTVSIIVEPIPKPSTPIVTGYYDSDGNGIVDSLHLEFDRPINLTNVSGDIITSFQIKWDTLAIVDLPVADSNIIDNGYTIDLSIPNLFNVVKTGGQMLLQSSFTLYDPVGDSLKDTTLAAIVNDKAAPVLTRAVYTYNVYVTDSTSYGEIVVSYSEKIQQFVNDTPFVFVKNDFSEYAMNLDNTLFGINGDLTSSQVINLFDPTDPFNIDLFPSEKDSVWILVDSATQLNPSSYVTDIHGNKQVITSNRRVPLTINEVDIKLDVLKLDLIDKDNQEIPDPLKIGTIETGTVLVLTLGNTGSISIESFIEKTSKGLISAAVYDLVANEVIKTTNHEYGEHLAIGVKTVNNKPAIILNWDARNNNDRMVSTGAYVIIVEISGTGNLDATYLEKWNIKQIN